MSRADRPGEAFEAAILRSIPKGVYARKMKTPPPPVPGARLATWIRERHDAHGGLLRSLQALSDGWAESGLAPAGRAIGELLRAAASPDDAGIPEWVTAGLFSRFTASPGYDLLILPPAPLPVGALSLSDALGARLPLEPRLLLGIACELKSTDKPSVPWERVNADQEKSLAEAEAGGLMAGVLIEFRRMAGSECWFIPLKSWRDLRTVSPAKSLPLADARRIGLELEPDPFRGQKLPYWDVAGFLSRLGAELPVKAEKSAEAKLRVTEDARTEPRLFEMP